VILHVAGYVFSEPIGSTKPKFPSILNSLGFLGEDRRPITLLCPAQGYPIPLFRYVQLNETFSEPIGHEPLFYNAGTFKIQGTGNFRIGWLLLSPTLCYCALSSCICFTLGYDHRLCGIELFRTGGQYEAESFDRGPSAKLR